MRRRELLRTAAGVAIAPVLSGCAAAGLFDAVADDVIIEDVSDEERTLRAVMFLTGVSELAADRVTNREPETAAETLAAVRQLEVSLAALAGVAADDPFFNTALYEADTAIVAALRNVARQRVRSIIDIFASGGVPSIDRVLEVLEAGGKANAMRLDAIRGIEMLRAETVTLADLTTAWRRRFDTNLTRIETLVGIQA